MEQHGLLVFGYGSLIFRPGFPYLERRRATAHGYVRRFYQGSFDHRGVPGAPGRVVTLVEQASGETAGVVYGVAAEERERVLALLDIRERGGYERCTLALRVEGVARDLEAVTYVARPGNPNYLGEAELDAVARQVERAVGPSGPNREYVEALAAALRALGAWDDHVFELERLIART